MLITEQKLAFVSFKARQGTYYSTEESLVCVVTPEASSVNTVQINTTVWVTALMIKTFFITITECPLK